MSDAAANTTAFQETPEYRQELLGGARSKALLIGFAGLVAFGVLGGILVAVGQAEAQQFMTAYLVAFVFWVSMSLGSLFFQCIFYVTGGRWGILMRRPMEANMRTWALGLVLFIPVAATMFAGKSSIYWWAGHHPGDHAAEHKDGDKPAEEAKAHGPFHRHTVVKPNLEIDEDNKVKEYLNPVFTVIRGLLLFGAIGAAIFWVLRNADRAENDPDEDAARRVRNKQKYAASVGLVVFTLSMTVIASDWVMSLEKTFASSMFPVIMFDDAAVMSYAFGMLVILHLKAKKHPHFETLFPATEQVHLGSMLLAFTLAWTYFNFSQYMLMWIGNLPEEIPYYLKRVNGGWQYYGILMTIFHFFVPFLLLLFRHVKSDPKALRFIAVGLIIVCATDVFWWINPSLSHADVHLYWLMDIAAWVGVGGIWVWYFLGQLIKRPLLPTRERYILEVYNHGH